MDHNFHVVIKRVCLKRYLNAYRHPEPLDKLGTGLIQDLFIINNLRF